MTMYNTNELSKSSSRVITALKKLYDKGSLTDKELTDAILNTLKNQNNLK